jgi:hypothetical protein
MPVQGAPNYDLCGMCQSDLLGMQDAAEHLEGQKKWLIARLLALEAELDGERAARDAAEEDADDAAATIRKLESKVRFRCLPAIRRQVFLINYGKAGTTVCCWPPLATVLQSCCYLVQCRHAAIGICCRSLHIAELCHAGSYCVACAYKQ